MRIKLWMIKTGFHKFIEFLRRPYSSLDPSPDNDNWHQHICLPLRLGEEMFNCFCPHKNNKDLDPEWSCCCDECDYLVIVDSLQGKLRIILPSSNDKDTLKKSNPTEMPYPIANQVSVGSIVITRNCLDVGLVTEVLDGEPKVIYARWSKYNEPSDECPHYGSVKTINWYDTGIHMSIQEWKDLSYEYDAEGFYRYWRTRLQIGM